MYLNRKKGFTLNELIIAMAITAILGTILVRGTQAYGKYLNDVNIDYCNNSIMMFINGAKNYCRNNNTYGAIIFSTSNSKMSFSCSGSILDRFIFPENFHLTSVTLAPGKVSLDIDTSGFTKDACTIKYTDRKGGEHRISVCVGTAYVEIKD